MLDWSLYSWSSTHAFKRCQFSTKYSFAVLTWSCLLWLHDPSFWNPLAVFGILRCGFSRINFRSLRHFWRFLKDIFFVLFFLRSRCKTDGEQVWEGKHWQNTVWPSELKCLSDFRMRTWTYCIGFSRRPAFTKCRSGFKQRLNLIIA